MENINGLELFGYLASVVTAVSLTMSAIVRLRWINLLGSLLFCVYGFLIGAMPVAVLNLFIAGVNVYFLWKLYSEKQHFQILETSTADRLLNKFIEYNRKEIDRYFPKFEASIDHDFAIMMHREFSMVGVLLGRKTENETLWVEIDFVLPQYRDLGPGKYLYKNMQSYFSDRGIRKIIQLPGDPAHTQYLQKVGFRKEEDLMVLNIA